MGNGCVRNYKVGIDGCGKSKGSILHGRGEAVSVRDVLEVYLLGKLTIPLSGHCGAASTVVKVALTIR